MTVVNSPGTRRHKRSKDVQPERLDLVLRPFMTWALNQNHPKTFQTSLPLILMYPDAPMFAEMDRFCDAPPFFVGK